MTFPRGVGRLVLTGIPRPVNLMEENAELIRTEMAFHKL